jgi:hypothetical protein
VNNDFQDYGFRCRRYPDFPLFAFGFFPTNDADQRGPQEIQEAGRLSCLDLSIPYWMYCNRRHSQVRLDVVYITLTSVNTGAWAWGRPASCAADSG